MAGLYPPSHRHVRRTRYRRPLILGCILLCVIAPLVFFSREWDESEELPEREFQSLRQKKVLLTELQPKEKADTLVLYVFSNTDDEYLGNLLFFLRHGVREGDGCDYVIVIQTGGTSKPLEKLPEAPKNVRFLHHPNECYDWGTLGWLFTNKLVDPKPYTHFIFMNASVRGPFLPPYLWGKVRWQELLTSRLSDKVKLVGPTISCEGSPFQGDVNGEWRTNPHVQSYVIATDKVGLDVLWLDGTVFGCYTSMWDVIYYSEIGSSWAVLKAGFSIDSLMMRYQGVDWTVPENWECNARINPYGEFYYDGITIDPFEVMFVKVKKRLLQSRWTYAVHAAKYDSWLAEQGHEWRDIVSNVWHTAPGSLKAVKIGYMRNVGAGCFDHEFYRQQNWDQRNNTSPAALWEHWVTFGQFESRPHRYKCQEMLNE